MSKVSSTGAKAGTGVPATSRAAVLRVKEHANETLARESDFDFAADVAFGDFGGLAGGEGGH
jgi:hypothetical protein